MSWLIRRKKDNIFEIDLAPRGISIDESYTLLLLTAEQQTQFLDAAEWKQGEHGVYIYAPSKSPVYELFMKFAKEKLQRIKTYNFAKKVESNVPGTSRLIRTSDRNKIYIGKRKGTSTLNQTRSNSVCISNAQRDEFFRDVRRKHEYCSFFGAYALDINDIEFTKWSNIMDNEYLKQTGQV